MREKKLKGVKSPSPSPRSSSMLEGDRVCQGGPNGGMEFLSTNDSWLEAQLTDLGDMYLMIRRLSGLGTAICDYRAAKHDVAWQREEQRAMDEQRVERKGGKSEEGRAKTKQVNSLKKCLFKSFCLKSADVERYFSGKMKRGKSKEQREKRENSKD